jgi:hypothetical protein
MTIPISVNHWNASPNFISGSPRHFKILLTGPKAEKRSAFERIGQFVCFLRTGSVIVGDVGYPCLPGLATMTINWISMN